MAACGAKTRSGRPCKQAGMPNGRCRMHGGATPIGPANANWKHGKHSKWLPKGLAEDYARAKNDPQLLTLQDEIALMDMRIGQLLQAVGDSGSTRLWAAATAAFGAFRTATDAQDADGARAALVQLEQTLTAGQREAVTWEELRDSLDLRRKLAEAEAKRMKDLHQMISVVEALHLMNQLVMIANELGSPALRTRMAAEVARLTGVRQLPG